MGKPDDLADELMTCQATPKKMKHADVAANDVPSDVSPVALPPVPVGQSSPVVSAVNCHCVALGPMPPLIPGKVWTPVWTLQDPVAATSQTSFEEIVLDKIKGPRDAMPPVKRRKIDSKTKIITDEQYLAKILASEEKERAKLEKTQKRVLAKKKWTSTQIHLLGVDYLAKMHLQSWRSRRKRTKMTKMVTKWLF